MNKTSMILSVLLAIAIIGLIVLGVLYNKTSRSSLNSAQSNVELIKAINRAGYRVKRNEEKFKKGKFKYELVKKENNNENNENITEEN